MLEAAHDFSPRRADVWPNVRRRHLEVHESGENFADVTEGTWVVGLFWERNRYDWSQPGSVKATVIDSNIFQPGSTWELRATARDRGSEVELVLHRGFRRGPKGRIAGAVHHTVGKMGLGLLPAESPRRSREANCLRCWPPDSPTSPRPVWSSSRMRRASVTDPSAVPVLPRIADDRARRVRQRAEATDTHPKKRRRAGVRGYLGGGVFGRAGLRRVVVDELVLVK